MSQGNIYKPRYKIAFQSKSKIWPYKNSRLRRFFNIRGRKLVRRGLFKRYFLVFNNMKWTIARRYIRPYMKRRRPVRRRFRNVFYSKQQLRAFYGKQKETAFRNFFKKFLGGAKGRNNMFAVALERRADVFLFRLRFLPTIYACHQFIHHFGVDINGKKEKSPYALVRPGDIVTFEKAQWSPFVENLYERLYWRVYGLNVWKRRQFKSLRKKVWWCYKNKFFKKSNASLLKKYGYVLRKVLKINNTFSQYLTTLYKEIKDVESRAKVKNIEASKIEVFSNLRRNTMFYWKDYRNVSLSLIKKINRLYKKKWRLKLWSWRNYYAQYFTLVTTIFRLYKTLKFYSSKFKLLELDFYKNLVAFNSNQNWKEDIIFYKNLKTVTDTQIINLNKEILYYKTRQEILSIKFNKIKTFVSKLNGKYKHFVWMSITGNFNGSVKGNISKLKYYLFNYFNKYNKKAKLLEKELNTVSQRHTQLVNEVKTLTLKFNGQTELLNKNIKNKVEGKQTLFSIIDRQADLVETRFSHFNKKLEFLLEFIIKRRIKRYGLKPRIVMDTQTGKKIVRKSPIIYFLTRRRMKKERRHAIPRLKKVHWYVPSYIYFDFRTLRAVFLYNPKPEEIVYSFKCSLKGLHSFYRSLGI